MSAVRQLAKSHVQPRSLAGYKDLLKPVTCEGLLDIKAFPLSESHVSYSWHSFYFVINSDGEFYYFASKLEKEEQNGNESASALGTIPLEDIMRVKATENTLRLYSTDYAFFLRAPTKDAMREWFFTIHRTFIGQLLDKLAENRHQRSYGPLSSRKHREGEVRLGSALEPESFSQKISIGAGKEEAVYYKKDATHTLERSKSGGYQQGRRWSHSIDLDQNNANTSSDSYSSGSEDRFHNTAGYRGSKPKGLLQYPSHLRTVDELGLPIVGESQIEQLPTSARAPSPPALECPTPGSISSELNGGFASPSPRQAYFDSSKRVVEAPLDFAKEDASPSTSASPSPLLHQSLSDDSVISRPGKLPSVSEESKKEEAELETEVEEDAAKGESGAEKQGRRPLRINVNDTLFRGKLSATNGKSAPVKTGKYVPPHLRGQNTLGESL